ncbi:MAG: hypothetical protein AAGE43_09575 [Pseudomonadota bacterium]
MAEHGAVARRFAELLSGIELDRQQFVTAVDGAVSARSLYSILNGHRRPSRSLAVLIEHLWGFRAAYLLEGEGPAWRPAARTPAAASADLEAVQAVAAQSPEHARTLRRDLDDAVLWTDLWQRTNRMLERLDDASEAPALERARQAFNECLDVADRYGELAACKYRRRVLHLVTAFMSRTLDSMAAGPAAENPAARFQALLTDVKAEESRLKLEEGTLRSALEDRARAPDPLLELDQVPADLIAARLLEARVGEVLRRR